ncbi:peptidase M48-like protein [Lentzea atacamensis]|uniref:Peptidase M48-like protein n=1 Tax=Lentzea atacamensis TaxID=531938 RepID=A0ABX9EFU7_9PSEU|nr:M56 family metallopeptidase [Lentzea atacamensis]RAS70050.1 peptidase M48-like protein [Lentzea atacamensis]
MTVALSLLLGCVVVGWLAPRYLLRIADPAVALVAWLVSVVAVVVTTAGAMLLLVLPDHGLGPSVVATLHHCWQSVAHGSAPAVEAVSGAVGFVLLAGLLARLAVAGVRGGRQRAQARREQLDVLRVAGRREEGAHVTVWLDHDSPLAFSLAGRPGVVVATEGLHRHLSPEQVQAVLTHEQAHLNGRHHLLVAFGDLVGATLPFLPLFRRTAAALRELVELAADATAVRKHGADAVRAALTGVAGHGAPGTALAMGGDSVQSRLAKLPRHVPGPARRLASCGLAGVTALVLPAVTALAALATLMLVSCPAA